METTGSKQWKYPASCASLRPEEASVVAAAAAVAAAATDGATIADGTDQPNIQLDHFLAQQVENAIWLVVALLSLSALATHLANLLCLSSLLQVAIDDTLLHAPI